MLNSSTAVPGPRAAVRLCENAVLSAKFAFVCHPFSLLFLPVNGSPFQPQCKHAGIRGRVGNTRSCKEFCFPFAEFLGLCGRYVSVDDIQV